MMLTTRAVSSIGSTVIVNGGRLVLAVVGLTYDPDTYGAFRRERLFHCQ